MMRTVAVATAIATLASVASTTLYLRFALEEVQSDAYGAKFAANVAEKNADAAMKMAGEMGVVVATQPTAEMLGETRAKLDGMRQELDEIQTQIRLLKLTAR